VLKHIKFSREPLAHDKFLALVLTNAKRFFLKKEFWGGNFRKSKMLSLT